MSKANPYHSGSSFSSRSGDRSTRRNEPRMLSETSEGRRSREADDIQEHPFELRHEVKKLNTRLDKIATTLEKSEMKDMIDHYMNPKKRIIANLTAGLSRGLGLTLGTALVLGLLGYILSFFVNVPMIGDFISDLQGYIDQSRS
ncbi:DUF5665 domain-containing protein [Paenibacillus sp. MDMC362]|uniref:DUF5665 domain-containing protein n=1 Tax=Paenibacillus sp. MDMC362 TaxID=2977365 RepID=UPI000DC2982E|nr:DUF5665 domain-containing protein [Paenibacillus sp. MDMC362]RAR45885.1 hypothetical protein DP091_00685 [Paenibacillus sp. MDMC362]